MSTSPTSIHPDREPSVGRWPLGLFFSLFLLSGCFFLVMIVWTDIVIPWKVNHHFQETTCVILNKRIVQEWFPGGSITGPVYGYRPDILIQYKVDGRRHRTWTYDYSPGQRHHDYGDKPHAQGVIDGFTVGQVYPCWYDPNAPAEAVLVRGYRHLGWLCFPWPFILIGGLGLISLRHSRTIGT